MVYQPFWESSPLGTGVFLNRDVVLVLELELPMIADLLFSVPPVTFLTMFVLTGWTGLWSGVVLPVAAEFPISCFSFKIFASLDCFENKRLAGKTFWINYHFIDYFWQSWCGPHFQLITNFKLNTGLAIIITLICFDWIRTLKRSFGLTSDIFFPAMCVCIIMKKKARRIIFEFPGNVRYVHFNAWWLDICLTGWWAID